MDLPPTLQTHNFYGLPANASTLGQGTSSVTLPVYTQHASSPPPVRRKRSEHAFELRSKSRPWATLKILSAAGSPKSLPVFVEGDKISGTISLNPEHGDHISSVRFIIKGILTVGVSRENQLIFLETNVDVWSKDTEDRFLTGSHEWPFAIALPTNIYLKADKSDPCGIYNLPESFLERHCQASIHYDITLRIYRSKFRHDSQLQTMFIYLRATQPESPSRLRQLAYQENSPLLGPDVDTEGWIILSPVLVRGTIFNTRSVSITCTLSLVDPLCYTRGSCIPLHLEIDSSDPHALDLLARPQNLSVRLRRRVLFLRQRNEEVNFVQLLNKPEKDSDIDLGAAIWWPLPTDGDADHCRKFGGEILLAKSLKPSTKISHFSLDYFVTLFPLSGTGFLASDLKPLLEERVEIATMFAKGPKPIIYSPPTYDSSPAMINPNQQSHNRHHSAVH